MSLRCIFLIYKLLVEEKNKKQYFILFNTPSSVILFSNWNCFLPMSVAWAYLSELDPLSDELTQSQLLGYIIILDLPLTGSVASFFYSLLSPCLLIFVLNLIFTYLTSVIIHLIRDHINLFKCKYFSLYNRIQVKWQYYNIFPHSHSGVCSLVHLSRPQLCSWWSVLKGLSLLRCQFT